MGKLQLYIYRFTWPGLVGHHFAQLDREEGPKQRLRRIAGFLDPAPSVLQVVPWCLP